MHPVFKEYLAIKTVPLIHSWIHGKIETDCKTF